MRREASSSSRAAAPTRIRRAIFQDDSTADPAKEGRQSSPPLSACGSPKTKSISQSLADEFSAFPSSPAPAVGGDSSPRSSKKVMATVDERPVLSSPVGMPKTGMEPATAAMGVVEDAATVGGGTGVTATSPVRGKAAASTIEGRGSTEPVSNGEGASSGGAGAGSGAAEAGGEMIFEYFR